MEIKVYDQLPEDAKFIRSKVFMEEQGFKNEFDDIDDIAIHILIYNNSDPVATCRIYYSKERNNYVLGRIAVLKEFRGRNYGVELLKAAEKQVQKKQRDTIELSAQIRVSAFYKKNGYIESNEVYDDEGCPHVWMTKKLK